MGHRIEAGPLVAMLGALVLLISLFLDWFSPGLNAWTVFEALDLLLAGVAVGALLAAAGLLLPEISLLDRRWLVPLAVLALVLVASQLVDPPPAAGDSDLESGAWLGLAGALLMGAGALLSFGRLRFAVTVEGHDPRRRVAAVDSRTSARSAAPGESGAAAIPASERLGFGVPDEPASSRDS